MPLLPLKLPAILLKFDLVPFAICESALKIGLVGVLGITGVNISAQAAITEPVGMGVNTDNPTADLQLISLNIDDNTVGSDAVGADDLSSENQPTGQTEDDIDAVADETAVDTVEDDLSDIPADVAQVSLNAISPETLKTFVAVVDLVRRQYVDPVNDEALFDNAMSGMLTKLDSHAEFLDAEAYENLRAFTEGDVGDVGLKAVYKPDEGYWVVTDIVDESPADKKGITVGDYIHQIGEFKVDGDRQSDDVEQLLNGIAGTQVDVTVSKAGRRKRVITLQRNNTHQQDIETRLVNGIAVIKLPAFQNNTREKILQSLTSLDAPITGILLDVRDNPGGVLTSAVKVASLFMNDTDVVQVKSRQSELRTLSTQDTALLKSLPVVILQNRYSASAAEVLASSLQTQKRATIVGEVSYGKGSVQSVIPLNNEQAVKLTVAHYLTAAGKKIDKIGVQPDIALSGNERTWEQQAIDVLRPQVHSSGLHFVKKDNTYSMTDTEKGDL
ncbi:S41 family peptidase [Psychrobacter sp. 1U1]|uniref:S41 family peptidase n=2 Tax=unclassified Psychrobacter TaxID=196806 RepID=UPI003F447722